MFKKNYFLISLWLVLGCLSGLLISSFFGKTEIHIPLYHNISNVLERTSPSVVNIWTSEKFRDWQEQYNKLGRKFNTLVVKERFIPNGSGVVFEKDLIVTNFHVIKYSLKQELLLENHLGERSAARILAYDAEADIAILGVIDPIDLKPVKMRKNIDQVKIGESVIAIGNPQGVGQSFSKGIVSAIRTLNDKKGSFIQTDASINPGSSGGALIDDKGRLIGIVISIQTTTGVDQGINFAIPVNNVIEVFNSLLNR